jgi:hypothetical protein
MAEFSLQDMHQHETYTVPVFVTELKPSIPPDVREGMFTGGGKRGPGIGWDEAAQINETVDQGGAIFPGVFNKGANQGEADANPWTQAMKSRRRDDPGVVALREHLRENNGINGLEICEPHEVERAARVFHRDGVRFVTPQSSSYNVFIHGAFACLGVARCCVVVRRSSS